MRRFLSIMVAVGVVALLATVAFAQMGRGPMAGGMGHGQMGPGMMGQMDPGMMGGGTGTEGCPGMTAGGGGAAPQITEDKARELAEQYAKQYLPGFTVERTLPSTGMHMTMYQVELKGPSGESRILHVNPWGNVMPFGGSVTR